MSTRVVNIRHTKEYDVYIGRPGHGMDGRFGNPILVGEMCPMCEQKHHEGWRTIRCFAAYLRQRMSQDPKWAAEVEALRGKRLGCFCAPDMCHGDIYVAYLDHGWREVENYLEEWC